MAVPLASFADFDALLVRVRIDLERLAIEAPGDPAVEALRQQLAWLHAWTRNGRCPAQDEAARLDLTGATMAHGSALAADLARLATFVTHWPAAAAPPRA